MNYNAKYKREKNGKYSETTVKGTIFSKANNEIDFYHESELEAGFAIRIINAVVFAISDEQNGLFVNDKPVMMIETKLMQSNANDAYAVLIDGDLYPISTNFSN